MSEFRTIVSISKSNFRIGLKDAILTLGSCFSDAMGDRFKQFKFDVLTNPFGVIYNPLSIHKTLSYASHNTKPTEGSYLMNQDVHLNFDFHSQFSSMSRPALEERISAAVTETSQHLHRCHCIILTYGTAWIYTRRDTGEVVANCHKVPASNFNKALLTEEQIVASFKTEYQKLLAINPDIRVILTVSPVRHVKDTLELNSVSKAVLRTSCHHLVQQFAHVEYFPAYEIMMDELRDYRFYKADMIHPTEQAEEFIWTAFTKKYMEGNTLSFLNEWQGILNALHHRPFQPASSGHQNFLKQTLRKLEVLESIVNVDVERAAIEAQLERNS
jgi:hypothetical protein